MVDEMLREYERQSRIEKNKRMNQNLRMKMQSFISDLPFDAPIHFRMKLQEALHELEIVQQP